MAFGVWALALTTLLGPKAGKMPLQESLHFRAMQGKGRQFSIATIILVTAIFSLAGFPLLASFPARLALWETLAKQSTLAAAAALLGCLGLLVGGIRALGVLITNKEEEPWRISEQWSERILLILGGLGLLLVGLFPSWFIPTMVRMATVFISGQP
jgi:NADH:ubiquinone oxidoreductase subunit 2 (subunit N)